MATETRLDKLMREQREYMATPAYQQDQEREATRAAANAEWLKAADVERAKLNLPNSGAAGAATATAAPALKFPNLSRQQMDQMSANSLIEYGLNQESEAASLAAAQHPPTPYTPPENWRELSPSEQIEIGMKMDRASGLGV